MCVETGPLPLLVLGLGEGSKLRLSTSLDIRGWALLGAAALCIALPGAITTLGNSAMAGVTLEERKLPMRFGWVSCEPNCKGWVSAVGIVTADSPRDFDEFARGRELNGATIVLDSSGGSAASARSPPSASAFAVKQPKASARKSRRKPIANRCACSSCCRARHAM